MIEFICFFKQKTAYEVRISDWSSDVCSSDLSDRTDTAIETRPRGDGGLGRVKLRRQAITIDGILNFHAANDLERGRFSRDGPQKLSADFREIGRASCRERVCQYVYISVAAVSLKKKKYNKTPIELTII